MDKQLQRYETYARSVKRLSLLAGLWPGRVRSRLFQLVIAVHWSSSIITSFGIVYFVVKHITNIALATKGLGIAISFCTILLKLMIFTMYRDHLVELHEELEKSFRNELENAEHRPVLLSPLEFFYRPTLWLTLSTFGIISMYNLIPPISFIIQLSHGVEVLQRRTPFPSQYPFPETNLLYVILYIIEVWASIAIGLITASSDALFGYYILQLASQFRVLSHRMINLNASDDHRSVIKECVVRRQLLARCRDKLQLIYGPIILWMLATSAITMCANIFQASQISIDKAALVFIYITMKLMQTLLYGWYGLFLTTESEAFRESIYFSGWPGCSDKSLLSNILTMMMCKPLVLRACHFSTVSLDMFMMIGNTTLSYFFLLRTLDEK